MIKKIFHLIIYIIWLFIFIYGCFYNSSYALTQGTVYLTSNKDVIDKDEEIEISVNIENVSTAAFNFFLYFDELKLEYISGPENTNVIGNRIIFAWYDETGGNKAKVGELVKFKFKAKEEGIATFSIQGVFYSNISQLIQTEFRETQIQIGKEKSDLQKQAEEEQGSDLQRNNANLQVLRIDKEGIVPNFQKDIYEYYLNIPNDIQDIEVLAIPENSNATIEISGNTGLQEGLNIITIKVTSEDKTHNNVYTIQVTKTKDLSLANTNLEILAIEGVLLNPPFDTYITNYETEISNEIENINMLAIPEDEKASVTIDGKDNLKEGKNVINVTVTAPNGFTKKKYQIIVHKRNVEEEKEYNEKQELNKQNLEQVYKVEELNSNESTTQDKNKNDTQGNFIVTIIILAILMIMIGIVFAKIKRRKK